MSDYLKINKGDMGIFYEDGEGALVVGKSLENSNSDGEFAVETRYGDIINPWVATHFQKIEDIEIYITLSSIIENWEDQKSILGLDGGES
jgi:hypothetical protein